MAPVGPRKRAERKVWARLRHAGLRTSKERVRRVRREIRPLDGFPILLTARARPVGGEPGGPPPRPTRPRRHDHPRGGRRDVGHRHDRGLHARARPERGQVAFGRLTRPHRGHGPPSLVALDHRSAECTGVHADLRGTRHEALEPIRQGVVERSGAVAEDIARGLSVRHDHGSQYTSHDSRREVAWLGAASSPALVCAPEGDGCAERFTRTPKENPASSAGQALLWVRTFRTVEELRPALLEFRRTYNEHWLIERHGHRSPAQFRRDQIDRQPMAAQLQTGVPRTGGGTPAVRRATNQRPQCGQTTISLRLFERPQWLTPDRF